MKSPADGAAAERKAILRYIRRLRKGASLVVELGLMEIEDWIRKRAKRCQARPGGLGLKKSK